MDEDPRQHAERLLQYIDRGRARHEVHSFPGGKGQVRIRVASDEDRLDALTAAHEIFRTRQLPTDSIATAQAFEDEVGRQLIALVCELPDDDAKLKGDPLDRHRPLFLSGDEVRKTQDKATCRALLELINDVSNRAAPELAKLTEHQYDLICEAVKKKDAELLRQLPSYLLSSFILTSASRRDS